MSVPQSVATILTEHVTLGVECLDRLYLNVYVPTLQRVPGVLRFFREHRGQPIASSALMAPISAAFVAAIKAFVARENLPLVDFKQGERKDDIAKAHLARFSGDEGILFVGRAQELTTVVRTEKRHNRTTGRPYAWIVPSTALVNQFYVYAVDADFGPFSRAYARLIRPALAQLVDPRPTADTRLRRPFEQLDLAIDRWAIGAKLAP